jgi:hypothetical protein
VQPANNKVAASAVTRTTADKPFIALHKVCDRLFMVRSSSLGWWRLGRLSALPAVENLILCRHARRVGIGLV